MRVFSRRSTLIACGLTGIVAIAVLTHAPFVLGDTMSNGSPITMGNVLDALLWPDTKMLDSIEPRSQWANREIITLADNDDYPHVLAPFYGEIPHNPEPDDVVFFVANPTLISGFGSVEHDSVVYHYWEDAAGIYKGPFYDVDAPYIVDMPLDVFWEGAPLAVEVNALVGLWGAQSLYVINDTYRIYHDVRSTDATTINLVVGYDFLSEGNALPSNLSQAITTNRIWMGRTEDRHVNAADLDFDDDIRIPGQAESTVRFRPTPETTIDLPISEAFYETGLAMPSEHVLGVIQVANNVYGVADNIEGDPHDTPPHMPGTPLFETVFPAIHYVRMNNEANSIQEITPLEASITIRNAPVAEMPDPEHTRLALWQFPLTLNLHSGTSIWPPDGRFSLAKARELYLANGVFSALTATDGLFVPLLTELWIDDTIPHVLAADSEKTQPITLTGILPTWMGATPDAGVTPDEAAPQYTITIDTTPLDFRTPQSDIEGFETSHAISPVEDVQAYNTTYLWTPPNLSANETGAIEVRYVNEALEEHVLSMPVTVRATALVETEVTQNVATSAAPATITLTPSESAIDTATGEYPLETGRFFVTENITATLDTYEGWGLVQWLRDGVAVSTDTSYAFMPDDGDTIITAEVASFALDIAVAPDPEYGTVSATPSPTPDTPGYAPGTTVLLEATPAAGFAFAGWDGPDAADLIIEPGAPHVGSIMMDSDKSVEALFTDDMILTVTVEPPESGVVHYSIEDESPVPFPDSGILAVTKDTIVSLFAESTSDTHRFKEWMLNDAPAEAEEDGSLQVTMDTDRTVTAVFDQVVAVTLDDPPEGHIEIVSPAPADGDDDPEKQTTHYFWAGDEITLRAVPHDAETHVLEAWLIDGERFDGESEGFSDTYVFTAAEDIQIGATFTRQIDIEDTSLAAIPTNRSVPLAVTGVFPASTEKSGVGLTADEAEARYEVLVGDEPASFIAPDHTPFTPLGEGITALDATDPAATNIAHIWTPAHIELPEDAESIAVIIRDRTNPLNYAVFNLPAEMLVQVVTLNIELLPETTEGVVVTEPEYGMLPGTNGDALPLAKGDYVAGDTVLLSAVPAYLFAKFRIKEADAVREVTDPDYELIITTDTDVVAMFESDAYQLTLVESEFGSITADPPSSPGWPDGWYMQDEAVTLTAVPGAGHRFVSWSHNLAGMRDNPVTIEMERDITAGALFLAADKVALTILPSEDGRVRLDPEGTTSATNPNVYIYDAGTSVQLLGRPNMGFRFDTWRIVDDMGDQFRNENPLTIGLGRDYVIAPQFQAVYHLSFSVLPENSGEIVVSPPEPAAGYDAGTVVTLTAKPDAEKNYRFVRWMGDDALDVHPNSTSPTVSVVMDGHKHLTARFSQLFLSSIEPAEAWIFGGIVARIRGEAIPDTAHIRFGDVEAPVFDVAPSGNYAFVEVPPLRQPGDANSTKVNVSLVDNDVAIAYEPGFRYNQRVVNGDLYTAAFAAKQAGTETSVFVGNIGGREAYVTVPPLGEAPVYGIVRVALPGITAASRENALEILPGAAADGLYDVALHLFTPRIGPAHVPQFGMMLYEDVTDDLLAFERPYKPSDAQPTETRALHMSMATQPNAGPTYAAIRNGVTLWGVASQYDYLYNAETNALTTPVYQSTLQNHEVRPENEDTVDSSDMIRRLVNARAYGAFNESAPANSFTWRQNATLPPPGQRAVRITAIDDLPIKGVGSGPVEGGTAVTLTSPYGGVAWIDSIELVSNRSGVGGKVAPRDLISVQGEDEFLLEFKTPRSSRPGMTSIVIKTAADPDNPIVLQNAFEYTRRPIRWWLVLLILLGLMFSVIGMATAG